MLGLPMTVPELAFWGTWVIVAAVVWSVGTLLARKLSDTSAAGPHRSTRETPRPKGAAVSETAIATFVSSSTVLLTLEAELSQALGLPVEPRREFAWADQQARALGIFDMATLAKLLRQNEQMVLHLARHFHWNRFRRGDCLCLLFQTLGAKLGPDSYRAFAQHFAWSIGSPEEVLRAFKHTTEQSQFAEAVRPGRVVARRELRSSSDRLSVRRIARRKNSRRQ